MHDEQQVKKEALEYFDGDELATNVWMTKYCLKDKLGNHMEKNPDDMHRRLAAEFARIESGFQNSLKEEEIYKLLKGFDYIVPQGSPMFGIGNDYVNASLSNCVVVASPEDNISSIMDSGKQLANLFKNRCGVGLDISQLRPENAVVNNAARTTTGAWSFADFYSYVCRMIGQNGRRGALMISMDVRHPDIENFVKMKEDLTKVTGANVSVKISDSFMEAVEEGGEFTLQFPVDSDNPTHTRTIAATDLWESIIESATKTAEPGLLMWDNITSRLPANEYDEFKTICVNPCAEIALSAYDSCRLISVNLKNFVKDPFTKKAKFDLKEFSNVVRIATRLSDDLVELENEKLLKIKSTCDTDDERELWDNMIAACTNGRRTGLGTHGLADAIACLNLPYDDPAAICFVDDLYRIMKISAYEESVKMAEERGQFPAFDWETEKDNSFIKDLPEVLQAQIRAHDRRNISILTNAPTGSVSLLSQTSTGIEPVFRNSYIRRRKLSHNEQALEADFVDDLGDRWVEYNVFHHNVKEFLNLLKQSDVPSFFVTSDQIDWKKRIEIQAAIQKHIDHSISSTINLPKDTEPSVVGELYLQGWKSGLKGITVYVDGSRSGVLITEDGTPEAPEEFPHLSAPKRPQELDCDIHHTTIGGEKWVVLVGILADQPYEVLAGEASLIEIPKKYNKGLLTKHCFKTKNNRYDLSFGFNGDTILIKDVVKVFDNPNNSAFTRMISLGLRHGAKARFMVEQLQKDKASDMFSFARCIARILKNYIEDGELPSDKLCTECNAETLLYQDGCVTCTSCGYAKCG